jgi:DNA-binding MarR family transcriptional regulator
MSMIVLPYLGPSATRAELRRPEPRARARPAPEGSTDADVLKDLGMRVTYRTLRVLQAVGANPGASNRRIAEAGGIGDQGQVSKLLHRLLAVGLLENDAEAVRGGPNHWQLTARGSAVVRVIETGGHP